MIGWNMFMSMRWARLHVTNTSHKQQRSKGFLFLTLKDSINYLAYLQLKFFPQATLQTIAR